MVFITYNSAFKYCPSVEDSEGVLNLMSVVYATSLGTYRNFAPKNLDWHLTGVQTTDDNVESLSKVYVDRKGHNHGCVRLSIKISTAKRIKKARKVWKRMLSHSVVNQPVTKQLQFDILFSVTHLTSGV